MRNKKASLMDSIYVPIYLLVIAMTIIIAGYVWFSISRNFEPIMNQTVPNTAELISNIDTGFSAMDYMFPMLVGGLLIVSLIFAFKSGANIIYAALSFILWIFAIFISAIFTNIFDAFVVSFPQTPTTNPIIYYIITNIRWVVLGWVFLISLVMFTRNRKEDDSTVYNQAAIGAQYG
jgi:hypothetical protein